MVTFPSEQDFGPHEQILIRKGKNWEVIHLSSYRHAKKHPYGLATMFYNASEWRRIQG